mmetsp:Transcript_17691/g.41529  ORF Transcript_17691/g.41529 Transcript_17691/m.41529 type:complete len:278 (-) Transcript_17691:980-1813(-)
MQCLVSVAVQEEADELQVEHLHKHHAPAPMSNALLALPLEVHDGLAPPPLEHLVLRTIRQSTEDVQVLVHHWYRAREDVHGHKHAPAFGRHLWREPLYKVQDGIWRRPLLVEERSDGLAARPLGDIHPGGAADEACQPLRSPFLPLPTCIPEGELEWSEDGTEDDQGRVPGRGEELHQILLREVVWQCRQLPQALGHCGDQTRVLAAEYLVDAAQAQPVGLGGARASEAPPRAARDVEQVCAFGHQQLGHASVALKDNIFERLHAIAIVHLGVSAGQ